MTAPERIDHILDRLKMPVTLLTELSAIGDDMEWEIETLAAVRGSISAWTIDRQPATPEVEGRRWHDALGVLKLMLARAR